MRCIFVLLALALASHALALGVGDNAPPLKVQTLVKGSPVDLGKGVHVVEFWASWYAPSTDIVPNLTALAKKYRGKADLTGVSVAERGDDPLGGVKKFVATMGEKMDYNVAYDGDKAATAGWLEPAQIDFMPAAFLVKDGKILWIGDPSKGLDQALDQTLKGTFDLAAAKAESDKRLAAKQALIDKAKADEEAMMTLLKPLVDAMQARDFDAAQKALDDIEGKRADLKPRLEPARFAIFAATNDPKLLDLAKRFAEVDYKDDAITLNQLAWSIVDPESQAPNPNYAAALVLSKRAAEASEMKDGQILDTYALALYRTGDKKQALEVQTKAVALVEKDPEVSPESRKEIEDRLEMFKKASP